MSYYCAFYFQGLIARTNKIKNIVTMRLIIVKMLNNLMPLTKVIGFKVIWNNLKCELNLGKKFFKKQSLFKKLTSCSKLIIKAPQLFSIVDFEHAFVTFLFIVWMIFIVFIIFIVFMICRKIGIGCTLWN